LNAFILLFVPIPSKSKIKLAVGPKKGEEASPENRGPGGSLNHIHMNRGWDEELIGCYSAPNYVVTHL
jgi:hypothetical protein